MSNPNLIEFKKPSTHALVTRTEQYPTIYYSYTLNRCLMYGILFII